MFNEITEDFSFSRRVRKINLWAEAFTIVSAICVLRLLNCLQPKKLHNMYSFKVHNKEEAVN